METIDGEALTLSEALREKDLVMIDLWATWCTLCVKELPYFDLLQQTYGGGVKVLTIHSDMITDDPLTYLSNYDYCISLRG